MIVIWPGMDKEYFSKIFEKEEVIDYSPGMIGSYVLPPQLFPIYIDKVNGEVIIRPDLLVAKNIKCYWSD